MLVGIVRVTCLNCESHLPSGDLTVSKKGSHPWAGDSHEKLLPTRYLTARSSEGWSPVGGWLVRNAAGRRANQDDKW